MTVERQRRFEAVLVADVLASPYGDVAVTGWPTPPSGRKWQAAVRALIA